MTQTKYHRDPTRHSRDRRLPAVLGLCAAMLLLTIIKPLGLDNEVYQRLAIDLVHFGRWPIIGSWDHNLPLITIVHAAAVLLFGAHDLSLRLLDLLIQLAFCAFFYRFLQRWLRPSTAALSVLLYVGYYVSASGLLLSERDVYGGMLTLIALHLLLTARDKQRSSSLTPWRLIASGAVSGLALAMRPTGVVTALVLSVAAALANPSASRSARLRMGALYLFASLLPLLLLLAAYATQPSGLRLLRDSVLAFNLELYAGMHNGFDLLVMQFARRAMLTPFIIWGLLRWKHLGSRLHRSPDAWERGVVLVLASTALLIALGMRKYFDYQFAPFYLMLLPIAALVMESVADQVKHVVVRRVVMVALFFSATFIVYPVRMPVRFVTALVQHEDPFAACYREQYPDAAGEQAVLRYFGQPEHALGSVEVLSFAAGLQAHLVRDRATRFAHLHGLAYRLNPEDSIHPRFTEVQLRWHAEYMAALRAGRPAYVVLVRETPFSYLTDVRRDLTRHLDGFDAWLTAHYQCDTTIGHYEIYRTRR